MRPTHASAWRKPAPAAPTTKHTPASSVSQRSRMEAAEGKGGRREYWIECRVECRVECGVECRVEYRIDGRVDGGDAGDAW